MNRTKYVLFGVIVGVCISLTVNMAICGLERFKTEAEHTEKRLTLNERVTKLEVEVKQLKRNRGEIRKIHR